VSVREEHDHRYDSPNSRFGSSVCRDLNSGSFVCLKSGSAPKIPSAERHTFLRMASGAGPGQTRQVPAEQFYAPGRVLTVFSYQTGTATLTILKPFAVGRRVPQVVLCSATESQCGGAGVYQVCFFDPRYVRKQRLIPVGLGSPSHSSRLAASC
jgi:hypothetical protein